MEICKTAIFAASLQMSPPALQKNWILPASQRAFFCPPRRNGGRDLLHHLLRALL
jgi:hypothetical protein